MKATINGITYEGTPEEIRDIIENPPKQSLYQEPGWERDDRWRRKSPYSPQVTWLGDDAYVQMNWDGSPKITCCAGMMY